MTKKVQRWKLLLEEFNYELCRIKGLHNKTSDVISRLATINFNNGNIYYTANEHLIDYTSQSEADIHDSCCHHSIEKHKFLLDNKNQMIFAENNKREILKKIHEDLSHPGSKRLYMTIYKYVTAKNLKREIELITASCHECQ